jgi:hypothetical protein
LPPRLITHKRQSPMKTGDAPTRYIIETSSAASYLCSSIIFSLFSFPLHFLFRFSFLSTSASLPPLFTSTSVLTVYSQLPHHSVFLKFTSSQLYLIFHFLVPPSVCWEGKPILPACWFACSTNIPVKKIQKKEEVCFFLSSYLNELIMHDLL